MINPAPETKLNEFVDEVNRFIFGTDEPNDFALRRLEREAENLKKQQLDQGFIALGILAALRKDAVLMRKNMDFAMHTQHSVDTLKSYAVSLGMLGFYRESAEKMAEAARLERGSDSIIKAMSTAVRVGRFAEANALLETVKDEKWTIDPKLKRIIPQGNALMKRHHLNREQVDDLVQAAETCIQQFESGRFVSKMIAHEVLILEHENQESVYIQYFLKILTDDDIEKVVDLDIDLAGAFAQERFRNNPALPYFTIGFSAMSPNELNDTVQRSF